MPGTRFWEDIAGGIAQKWVDRLLSPALIFLTGGLLAYATTTGWEAVIAPLRRLEPSLQLASALGSLIVVVGLAAAVESVQQSALRLLGVCLTYPA